MTHTKDFKCAYHDEAAHASGHGSTKNTPEELVAADLTAMDAITQFNPGYPKPKRSNDWCLNSGLTPDAVGLDEVSIGEGSLAAYFQTSILYDWAMSPTQGACGTTKSFRFNDGDAERDIYGCTVTKYTVTVELGKRIRQDVEFNPSQAKIASCTPIVGGIPAFSTAARKNYTDLSATIDSLTGANINLQKLTLTIENVWDEENDRDITSVYRVEPALLERKIECEIEYRTPTTSTWFADEMNQTVQLITAALNLSIFTTTLTNYNVWETDQSKLEERGIIKYRMKCQIGVGGTTVKS